MSVAVWVQLKQAKYITTQGKMTPYQPGDWVKVGSSMARQWIADGTAIARDPNLNRVQIAPGSAGIMMFGAKDKIEINIECSLDGDWAMRWERTLFLQGSTPVQAALIPVGFDLLRTWEVAVPLVDYRILAQDEGDEEEQAYTAKVIRDLRVPLYDTRMIFMRRCESSHALLAQYQAEGFTRLGFLRALYRVKPLVLALPVTWTGQWAPTTA